MAACTPRPNYRRRVRCSTSPSRTRPTFLSFPHSRTRKGNPMSERVNISAMLGRLDNPNASERDLAAAEITDLIEAKYLTTAELKKVVARFLRAARSEPDPSARESIFNGLSEASLVGGRGTVNAHEVAEMIDDLPTDCLEHALIT